MPLLYLPPSPASPSLSLCCCIPSQVIATALEQGEPFGFEFTELSHRAIGSPPKEGGRPKRLTQREWLEQQHEKAFATPPWAVLPEHLVSGMNALPKPEERSPSPVNALKVIVPGSEDAKVPVEKAVFGGRNPTAHAESALAATSLVVLGISMEDARRFLSADTLSLLSDSIALRNIQHQKQAWALTQVRHGTQCTNSISHFPVCHALRVTVR